MKINKNTVNFEKYTYCGVDKYNYVCKHFNGYSIDGTIKKWGKGEFRRYYHRNPSTLLDTITIRNRAFKLKNYSQKGISTV